MLDAFRDAPSPAFGTPVDAAFGLYLPLAGLSGRDLAGIGAIVGAGAVVGLFPAIRAYRMSLADGMTVRS